LDFKRIKAEYIAGGTSYRKLAEKYNVPFGTLRRVAKQEAWTQKRAQVEHRVNTKMVETIIENETQKAVDIVDVADRLLGKIKEVLEVVTTTQDIRHLTSALKDLREIKGIKSEADIREQEARIAKLNKEVQEGDNGTTEIKVTFGADTGEDAAKWAE
jgi:predicted sugar kinase